MGEVTDFLTKFHGLSIEQLAFLMGLAAIALAAYAIHAVLVASKRKDDDDG